MLNFADLAKTYRLFYRNYYMVPTSVNIGQQLECQMFDEEGNGFPGKVYKGGFGGY